MAANHTIFVRPQALNGTLTGEIEVIGAPPYDQATQNVERVRQQQQFRGGVQVRTLPGLGVPGISNLQTPYRRQDVVVNG